MPISKMAIEYEILKSDEINDQISSNLISSCYQARLIIC
ncbi:hypothetical protein CAMRE0001_0785 [Campylobacter rectus RM3267]|uniref:Uncharacterized protein n=1 Tax=Campylobacter rectus RM3267 TaxID=553218 RepID=B9CZU3_CAMRE|nr:hypothetical protein CAMRE0001_0785 [Campylobacter rectus RM3267]